MNEKWLKTRDSLFLKKNGLLNSSSSSYHVKINFARHQHDIPWQVFSISPSRPSIFPQSRLLFTPNPNPKRTYLYYNALYLWFADFSTQEFIVFERSACMQMLLFLLLVPFSLSNKINRRRAKYELLSLTNHGNSSTVANRRRLLSRSCSGARAEAIASHARSCDSCSALASYMPWLTHKV